VESLHNTGSDHFRNNISPRTVAHANLPISPKMFATLGIKTSGNSPANNTKMMGFTQKDEDTISSKLLPVPTNKASLAF
jgi:hypothetical protein